MLFDFKVKTPPLKLISNRCLLTRRLGLDLIDLETALVLIFTFLGPENLAQHNGPNHHVEDKDVHQYEREDHGTSKHQNRLTREGMPYGKGGSDQSSIREDKREPGHGEYHPPGAYHGQVGKAGYEKEEDR